MTILKEGIEFAIILLVSFRLHKAYPWCSFGKARRQSSKRLLLQLEVQGDVLQPEKDGADSSHLEQMAREMASRALEGVLFFHTNNTVSTEKALKQTLKSVTANDFSSKERKWMRARLSKLILGTSIMRLHHEFVWNETAAYNSSSFEKIRAMVDIHAIYLENNNAFPEIQELDDTTRRFAVQYSLPLFLIEDLVDQYGEEETEELCRKFNQPGPITLRRNTIKCPSVDTLIDRLAHEEDIVASILPSVSLAVDSDEISWKPPSSCLQLPCRPHKRSIWSMPCWKDGWFEVQDLGSQLIAHATEAKTGEIVVDYCAGNGGKTLALASLMHSTDSNKNSIIWAHDVVAERLAQIRGSLQRAGLVDHPNLQVKTATSLNETYVMADVVLVDAPCSSSGVLRRRPSHRWTMTEEDMRVAFPDLQLKLMQIASKLVKPGGRLVYATCSICKSENQNVIDAWELLDNGSSSWEPWAFDEKEWPLQQGVEPHCRTLLPHIHDSDGFFVARWQRK